MRRLRMRTPVIALGDDALGFWGAVQCHRTWASFTHYGTISRARDKIGERVALPPGGTTDPLKAARSWVFAPLAPVADSPPWRAQPCR